jgi:flagellar hook protein FlgE
MGLTTSLYIASSGLTSNSEAISVAGNNIANVNTTAFKRSRVTFETQVSTMLSPGSAPSAELGGTNPSQVNLGTRVGAVSRDLSDGALQPTGRNTDLAIEGNGFFVLKGNGKTQYTRDGSFQLDRDFNLVSSSGRLVQGYGVDEDFVVQPNLFGNLNIPLGGLAVVEATKTVKFTGHLNAGGDTATAGSITVSNALFSDAAATTPATGATALTGLFDSSGATLFTTGDVLTVSGVTKGGSTVPDRTFEVNSSNTTQSNAFGTTLQDVTDFLEDILGINTTVGGGVTVNASGQVEITSNTGTANAIDLEAANLVKNASSSPALPFSFTSTQEAVGESVRTTFTVFDSLGTALTMDVTMALQGKGGSGTTWRYYAQSYDNTDLSPVIGTGLLSFNTDGQLIGVDNDVLSLLRENTGALSPQEIRLAFADEGSSLTALSDTESLFQSVSQDGSELGTLQDFTINEDGTISGVFSNRLLRTLGRVTLALFPNPEAMVDVGGNLLDVSVNSGNATLVTPATSGAGRIVAGALELSNVELSEEFINLITASTGFSANSRVFTTSDQLIQELLAVIR